MIEKVLKKLNYINEEANYSNGVRKTLGYIEGVCKGSSGKKSSWYRDGRLFFMEWPELGTDDSDVLTGDVYEKVGASSRFVGTYKIDKDGNIIKFPYFIGKK